jgi:hypothetical protein
MRLKLIDDHQETILLQGDVGDHKRDIPDHMDCFKQELPILLGE